MLPLLLSLLAAPITATAANGNLLSELGQLESVGYGPAADDPSYPANLRTAEHRVQLAQMNRRDATAVGGVETSSEDAGRRTNADLR
ncbi:DUF4148 domain-containing protein [Caballeronia sp. LZ025]|uniref:DUF4148 domain-containing protein n=1 Tax=Caballeronia TaxID=1827195 RepID=UPI001FD4B27D|nr:MULTISPECIES: DUF4148 domain-containing protein [Caballeronia]MDR5734018.1 DUF4148 domain-containing protein [Caballeronia sp. LZ025]